MRTLSSSSTPQLQLNLKDPLQLLSLAIRLDERDEKYLETPLESVTLHRPKRKTVDGGNHQATSDNWQQLLQLLQQYETMESRNSSLKSPWSEWWWWCRRTRKRPILPPLPNFALTPLLLSGLIAAVLEKERKEYDDELVMKKNDQQLDQGDTSYQLSGFDGKKQQREDAMPRRGSVSNNINQSYLSASDLVVWCKTMRRSAVKRVKARKRRQALFKRAAVLLAIVMFLVACCWRLQQFVHTLVRLGYLSNYVQAKTRITTASLSNRSDWHDIHSMHGRLAEANLWMTLQDHLLRKVHLLQSCNLQHCSSRWALETSSANRRHGPYALHSQAIQQRLMTMEDLKGDKSLHPDRIHVSFDQTNQQYLWDDEQCDTPVNWLGGTSIINRLVRNALVQHLGHDCGSNRGGRSHSKRELRVLDVGCGIGGMLYALLPSPATLSSSSSVISTSSSSSSKTTTSCGCWERLWYHGVSASAAEIYHANLLAEAHGLVVVNGAKQAQHQEDDDDRPNLNFHLNIQFQQVDFGQPGALPTDQYTAAIAIESLSYSQNISNTLMNLYKTLPSGGVLVVVDDVAAFDRSTQKRQQQKQQGTAGERRMKQLSLISARPSFLTHAQWIHEFDKVGFVIQDAVDIGLEYDLPELFTAEAFARRAIKWIGYTFLRPWIQQILTLVRKGHVQTNGTDNTWWDRLAVYTGVIELVHDSLSQMKAAALRKEAHQRSDLTYNMYVCVK